MRFFRSKDDARLDQAISELRAEQPDSKTLAASAEDVRQKVVAGLGEGAAAGALQPIRGCADIRAMLPAFHQQQLPAARALIVEDHLKECVSCRSFAHGRSVQGKTGANWQMEPSSRGFQWSFGRLSFAGAALAVLVAAGWAGYNWYIVGPPGSRARVDSIAGQAYRVGWAGENALNPGDEISQGEFIRTAANSHAVVRLFDGSKVEMNQRAELAVSANRRNTTIHLDQGSIIVQAAHRKAGHLYVSAPDCNVAVTGTVFSVNSGTKGSRVSVIEGEVRVKHAGQESILHSGDQVATTQSVGLVPVSQEISWSSDRDHELALLAEFSQLRQKFEQIQTPGPRYESKILPLLPSDTVLYVGIPNLGEALQQANQIFQQQLSQSKVLQDWWNKSGHATQHPTPEELIGQIQAISQYLGDEVVITFRASPGANDRGPILLAEVKQPGLKDYLQNRLAATISNGKGSSDLHVLDQQSLSSLAATERGMIMLVRQNMLVVGGDAASVQQMSDQLDTNATQFASTDFGKRILNVYNQGTETVVAADLGQILGAAHNRQEESNFLQSSGFNDIKYLIATRGETTNHGSNRIAIEFSGPRRGIASWLAAPAPTGSLDYVSANAGAAFTFVAKQPAQMFDDVFKTVGAGEPDFNKGLAEANAELGLNLRDDLANALGGEMTIALDGPVLPTPSWKAIIEVNQSGALQLAIEKMVQAADREAQKENHSGLTLNQTQVGGRTFYTITAENAALTTEYDYTFADGYLILAPSRALLISAIETHANGTSLARSASFRALLPSDDQANFSAMLYQNLSPILKPLASQLNSGQLAVLQQLAADSKPSVMCAYGESDRIEVASSGKLLDLNPTFPALLHLLGTSEHGTSR